MATVSLDFTGLDGPTIGAFLTYLESERGCVECSGGQKPIRRDRERSELPRGDVIEETDDQLLRERIRGARRSKMGSRPGTNPYGPQSGVRCELCCRLIGP
jgi:hypothetical protein